MWPEKNEHLLNFSSLMHDTERRTTHTDQRNNLGGKESVAQTGMG